VDAEHKPEEKIVSLIASSVTGKYKKTPLARETQLQRELGLDSLRILALVFRFEEEFGVDLSKMNVEINIAKLRTIGDLIEAAGRVLEQAREKQNA
jgi:acyl carrier protein